MNKQGQYFASSVDRNLFPDAAEVNYCPKDMSLAWIKHNGIAAEHTASRFKMMQFKIQRGLQGIRENHPLVKLPSLLAK